MWVIHVLHRQLSPVISTDKTYKLKFKFKITPNIAYNHTVYKIQSYNLYSFLLLWLCIQTAVTPRRCSGVPGPPAGIYVQEINMASIYLRWRPPVISVDENLNYEIRVSCMDPFFIFSYLFLYFL